MMRMRCHQGRRAPLAVLSLWAVSVLAKDAKGADGPGSIGWFGMPERPLKDSGVGWGETAVQRTVTQEMIDQNPWWAAVREWRFHGTSKRRFVRQKMIIVGGLPRSGTTLLEMFLRSHDRISLLSFGEGDDTHEGGTLLEKEVFPSYGGSRAGYSKMCVDKMDSNTAKTEEEKVDIFRKSAWKGWNTWNFTMSHLVVKDPPNLVRMRYMQKAFQETHDVFAIFTLKHPLEIATAYTCNPRSTERQNIAKSWLQCHEKWLEDLGQLRNYLVIPFEAWFLHPRSTGKAVEAFLNLQTHTPVELPKQLRRLSALVKRRRLRGSKKARRLVFHGGKFLLSKKYFAHCRKTRSPKEFHNLPIKNLRKAFSKYGYDLADSTVLKKPIGFELCVLDGMPCRDLK